MSGRSQDPRALRDEVFTRVFDEHWSAVRRHIECVVEDDAEVTALVSEVFLFAWSRLKPAKPMGRVWLLRAADCRLRTRTGPARTLRAALDAVHAGVTGDSTLVGRVGQAEVIRALGVLSPAERRMIMLTYWDGLAVEEIAKLIRASEFRVRKTLGRAQDRLCTEMGLEGWRLVTTENGLFERALTEGDPARTPRDATPDARAIAMRDRIMQTSGAPRKRRRVKKIGWATGFAAVAASAALAFAVFAPVAPATAGTPSPLDFEGSNTVARVVDEASSALASTTGPVEPLRIVRTASWGFSVDVGTKSTTVVPQLSTLTWEADGSGHMTIIEGVPYDPADAVASNTAEVKSSGEIVADFDISPEQFASPWLTVPGDSPDEMVALLRAFGMPEHPTAYDVESAITSVFGQWTLTNAQHRILLALLEDTGGGEALGTTTDRLGRLVTGIRILSPDEAVSDLVLASLETGRIVGVERTVLKADAVFPAGAIVYYMMWEVDPEAVR